MAEHAQVTSESILADAYANRDKPLEKLDQTIQDTEELESFQLTKRKEFEQQLNKNRLNFGQWLRYARWEIEHNHDFRRARSIYERALQVNVEHVPFWIQYIQFELTHKNVNHARNLLDRAVTVLPQVDKFWYLYIQTEEKLANYDMVAVLFERWLSWHPATGAWDSYVLFYKRYEQFDKVREVYQRYIERFQEASSADQHGEVDVGEIWLKWALFELSVGQGYVRSVFENAADNLFVSWRKSRLRSSTTKNSGSFCVLIDKWARWEVSQDEHERANAIYEALIKIVKDYGLDAPDMYQLYTEFKKTYSGISASEASIREKRAIRYKEELQQDPYDYDTWWAYLKLKKEQLQGDQLKEIFEDACSRVPPGTVKSLAWKRYVYLWIYYAYFAEFELQDIELARSVWQRALKTLPHLQGGFTFGKLWIGMGEFEIRHSADINAVRKLLGRSIGVCTSIGRAKPKILRYYIELEKRFGEWDRCRKLYEKWLEFSTTEAVLMKYVEFEKELQEDPRVVALYEICLKIFGQWSNYIQYLTESLEYEQSRELYRRLIDRGGKAKEWISFALFESSIPTDEQLKLYDDSTEEELEFEITQVQVQNTRGIFKEAFQALKAEPEQRVIVLEAWKSYEERQGDSASVEEVQKKFPTLVTRRKVNDEGVEEEYIDYLFEQDEEVQKKPGINKFLENAKKWKLQQQKKQQE